MKHHRRTSPSRWWLSVGCQAVTAIALVVSPLSILAKEAKPNLQGTWVQTSTSLEDARWKLEDLLCGTPADCPVAALQYTRSLLANSENDDVPLQELNDKVAAFSRKYLTEQLTNAALEFQRKYSLLSDPVNKCEPTGLFRGPAPLPIQIQQSDDRILIKHEFWNAVRTVYMDGREHPANLAPSKFGHSIGWFDGSTLVVETTGIAAGDVIGSVAIVGVLSSPRAMAIERYTVSADRSRLDLDFTVIDPVTLRQPVTFTRGFLSVPDRTFKVEERCERDSGER